MLKKKVTTLQGLLGITGCVVGIEDLKKKVGPAGYKALLNKLTLVHRPRIGMPISARVYKTEFYEEGGGVIYIPRDSSRLLLDGGVIDELDNSVPDGTPVNFRLDVELMDNQKLAVEGLFATCFTEQRLEDGYGNGILEMAPGLGKTFTAAAVIGRLGRRALYICVGRKLQQQAAKDLSVAFPDSKIVTPEGSAECKVASGDIVVAIINSIVDLDIGWYSQFGTIIIDEIHMYCSEGRRELFWKCQSRAVLGMSGTTNHNRFEFDAIYKKHLGEPMIAEKLPGFENPTEFSVTVRAIKYENPKAIDLYRDGHVDFVAMLEQFINDESRNKLIAEEIMAAVKDLRPVIVFSDRLEHLRSLDALLKAAGCADTTTVTSESSIEELEKANMTAVILTTYGSSGTGLSIPRLVHAVLATPRRRGHEQIVKRIMRARSDNKIERVCVDVIDASTKIKSQYYARANVYKALGFKIEKKTVKAGV